MAEEGPTVPAPAPELPPAAALQTFMQGQTAGFHTWLYHAVKSFNERGELPEPLFNEEGGLKSLEGKGKGKGKKSGAPRKPRQMSAFNFFVQQKMHEFKEKGIKAPDDDKRALFSRAVNDWKELPDDARVAFVAEFKETHPPLGPDGTPLALVPDAQLLEEVVEEEEAEEEEEAPPTKPKASAKKDKAEGGKKKKDKEHKHKKAEEPAAAAPEPRSSKRKSKPSAAPEEAPAAAEASGKKKKKSKGSA